jgi:glyoxylase-like metal-dependent hydrolase (beta-lactamase superfamily II)
MEETLPGVFTWPAFSERHGYDFNGWLFRDPAGNVCVDPVETPDDVLDAIAREGVSRIVLTNRNHVRASAKVRARTGAKVAIHPADAEYARSQGAEIDEALSHGQRIGPFVVVPAAGKSPGEIALHDAARRILVVGDACVGKPPGALALLPAKVIDDLPALQHSLRRIADEVDFDVLLPGDGAPILSGARAALRALCATFPG